MKYIPLFLIIFVIACEQVVEIDVPEHDSQLVLSSFYKSGDLRVTAFLTKSLSISSLENTDDVWDATVKFYENDVLLGDLEVSFDTTYYSVFIGTDSIGNPIFEDEIRNINRIYLLELSAPLEDDKTYKITAEAPDFMTISATQRFPSLPNIVNVNYLPMSRPGLDGYVMDALDIQLQDTADEDNYYEFKIYSKGGGYNGGDDWRKEWTESFTPGVENGYYGVSLIRDELFKNSSYDIELLTWPEDTSYVDFKVEVNAISRDRYLFSKSMQAYYNADGNPFAEPVIVHTNVENGQGVFSIENTAEWVIE